MTNPDINQIHDFIESNIPDTPFNNANPETKLHDIAKILAHGVCAAYASYNNGSNNSPQMDGYQNFQVIQVYEFLPDLPDLSQLVENNSITGMIRQKTRVRREPEAYSRGALGISETCAGQQPLGSPSSGYQFFGFTATDNNNTHNILVLRGTVTTEEATYDLMDWGDKTYCLLPSDGSVTQNCGQVKLNLFDFYTGSGILYSSLASSCLEAISAINQNGLPWFMGGHSLGGAVVSLVALDAHLGNYLTDKSGNKIIPFVVTFGSLHLGDSSFKDYYNQIIPTLRIANMCDFVPSMVSIEPYINLDPYEHVGCPATFVWQKWDDWGNHSLANIYIPIVNEYWSSVYFGERDYPY